MTQAEPDNDPYGGFLAGRMVISLRFAEGAD